MGDEGGTAATPEPCALQGEWDDKIRPMLDRYNRIREHLKDEPDIHAAQIVVIGDQSSGKSSVLESLIHVNLPRGSGVTTKVPIVLESHCLPADDGSKPYATVRRGDTSDRVDANDSVCVMAEDLWADIQATPEPVQKRRKTDAAEQIAVEQLEEKIREEQEAILKGKEFSDTPLYVHVYQRGVPDITLVDLPGINYSSQSSKMQIRRLYEKHITPEESLILNVIPATSDVVTNESILYAKRADPRGTRTVNVLTKVDRAEMDIAEKVRTLGRFVVVRNRTQEELAAGVSVAEVRRLEEEAIARHPSLAAIAGEYRGARALAKLLVREDLTRMRTSIHKLLRKVPAKQTEFRRKLDALPRACGSEAEKRRLFDDMIRQVNTRVHKLLNGEWDEGDDEAMHMNARIQDHFDGHDRAMRAVTAKFFQHKFRADCHKQLKEGRGQSLPNFIQSPVLKTLMNKEIESIRPLTEDTITEVSAYIVEKVSLVTMHTFDQFDQAGREVVQFFTADLDKAAQEVRSVVGKLFEAELHGPYTINHYYMDTLNKIRDQMREQETPSADGGFSYAAGNAGGALLDSGVSVAEMRQMVGVSNEDQSTFDMCCALFSYWKVVHKRITDYTHMMIRCTLCRRAEEGGDGLWEREAEVLRPLMSDPPAIAAERRSLEHRMQNLVRVEQELGGVGPAAGLAPA